MEQINRYTYDGEESATGPVCLYDSHKYIVDQLLKEISDLEDEVQYLRDRYT